MCLGVLTDKATTSPIASWNPTIDVDIPWNKIKRKYDYDFTHVHENK